MAASPAITPIGAAFCSEFIAMKMNRACPSFTGSTTNLYVINKIIIHFFSDTLNIKALSRKA
jgi:hypothetical protein